MRRLLFALAAACAAPDPAAAAVDRIVVEKAARRMTLYDGAAAVATYRVALGFAPVGDKRREGDGRTPEGVYRIDFKNPQSRFHRSLRVSYPDATDTRAARRLGVAPGGDIFIHGTPGRREPWPPGARIPDWTLGCIAVTDGEIEEIYRRVAVGTRIEIRP
ncbi:MAG: L,D-transpeptidase family protein [Parvularculaceae bacterium]|nr:L,D-transpeptidase family protein [Parvularculaceae bacterium]